MHPFSRRALLALPLFVAFAASADDAVTNTIVMRTKDGDVVIRLRPDLAPKHVKHRVGRRGRSIGRCAP